MRGFLVGLAIAVCASGCATAGKENSIIGGITDAGPGRGRGDANDFPTPDASLIDAPASQVTLVETTSTTITDRNSVACVDGDMTRQASYYRVFTLADYGITTTLHVTEIDFGIELADAGPDATQQPATINLGLYGAPPTGTMLDPSQVQPLRDGLAAIMIPDGAGTRMAVPITADVPPGMRLIVELALPDGDPTSSAFVIGSNAQGERQPGYISAADCNLAAPTTMQSITAQQMISDVDLLISVIGTQ